MENRFNELLAAAKVFADEKIEKADKVSKKIREVEKILALFDIDDFEVGTEKERIYPFEKRLYYKSITSKKIYLRPLIEAPIDIRIAAESALNIFLEELVKRIEKKESIEKIDSALAVLEETSNALREIGTPEFQEIRSLFDNPEGIAFLKEYAKKRNNHGK